MWLTLGGLTHRKLFLFFFFDNGQDSVDKSFLVGKRKREARDQNQLASI